jgi:hypothetical protein
VGEQVRVMMWPTGRSHPTRTTRPVSWASLFADQLDVGSYFRTLPDRLARNPNEDPTVGPRISIQGKRGRAISRSQSTSTPCSGAAPIGSPPMSRALIVRNSSVSVASRALLRFAGEPT